MFYLTKRVLLATPQATTTTIIVPKKKKKNVTEKRYIRYSGPFQIAIATTTKEENMKHGEEKSLLQVSTFFKGAK